jgi:hypothetical protein
LPSIEPNQLRSAGRSKKRFVRFGAGIGYDGGALESFRSGKA